MSQQLNQKLVILPLVLVILLDSMGLSLIYPILPKLFLSTNQGLIHSTLSLHLIDFYYGLSLAVFPLGSFVSMPFLGSLSDRMGRKNILLMGLLGISFGYASSALAIMFHSLDFFLLGRFISGFAAGAYVLAQAAMADVSINLQSKMLNMRWPIFASLVGVILGPTLSILTTFKTLFLNHSLAWPFWIAAALSLVNFGLLWILFTETYRVKQTKLSLWQCFINCKRIVMDSRIRLIGLGIFIYQFGYGIYAQSITLVLAQDYGFSQRKLGFVYVILGLAMLFTTLVIQPILIKKIDFSKRLAPFIMVLGVVIMLPILWTNVAGQWAVLIIQSVLSLIIMIPLMALISNRVNSDEQGIIMGSIGSLMAVAWVLSAIVGGFLESISHNGLYFLAGGVILSSVFIVSKSQAPK